MSEKYREALAKVLEAHQYMPCATHTPTVNAWWAQCEGCDWRGPRRSHRHADEGDHRAHVADLLAQMLADAKAEALREAADRYLTVAAQAVRAAYDEPEQLSDNLIAVARQLKALVEADRARASA